MLNQIIITIATICSLVGFRREKALSEPNRTRTYLVPARHAGKKPRSCANRCISAYHHARAERAHAPRLAIQLAERIDDRLFSFGGILQAYPLRLINCWTRRCVFGIILVIKDDKLQWWSKESLKLIFLCLHNIQLKGGLRLVVLKNR